jgi:hypothetical protein
MKTTMRKTTHHQLLKKQTESLSCCEVDGQEGWYVEDS